MILMTFYIDVVFVEIIILCVLRSSFLSLCGWVCVYVCACMCVCMCMCAHVHVHMCQRGCVCECGRSICSVRQLDFDFTPLL